MLDGVIEEIRGYARAEGLTPLPVHFEIVPSEAIYEFGAYGLPGRFSHWSHGKAYQRMKLEYDYGLTRIYELICNGNPAIAFLLDNNELIEQKMIIAHVFAHADFFNNNRFFEKTAKETVELARVHAERIRHYEFQCGLKNVEEFIDSVLSIKYYVDEDCEEQSKTKPRCNASRLPREWEDLFSPSREEDESKRGRFPAESTQDIMGFIMRNAADLEDWQRDIMGIIRAEMLYFRPQITTKIINEGWAAYWHREIMRKLPLTPAEQVDFARLNAKLLTNFKMSVNPYLLGMTIFEEIENAWGRDRIFEARELCNDLAFIRNFLTKEIVDKLNLYTIVKQETPSEERYLVGDTNWEQVKSSLLSLLTNGGVPYIVVEDGNYEGRGDLYLKHVYDGRILDVDYACETLKHVRQLWGQDVYLESADPQGKFVLKATADGCSRI